MSPRRLLILGLLVLATAGLLDTLTFADASPLRIWTSAAATALTAVVLAEDLRRRQAGTLRAFSDGARRVATGEFGHKVYPGGAGDLAELGRAFNAMSERLAE